MVARGVASTLLALAGVLGVLAVDRSKFRTCDQGSFCRRYRKWVKRESVAAPLWSVLPETREGSGGEYSFKVKHVAESEPHLELRINAYLSGIVRVRINEIAPLHPRYVIPEGDVVVSTPIIAPSQVNVLDVSGSTRIEFEATGGKVRAVLMHSPLSLEIAVDGRVVQRLNSRNLMNFERYRVPKQMRPPDAKAEEVDVVVDAAAFPGVDTDGLWEESFGGHEDKKPRGPASFGMDVTFEGDVPSLFGLSQHMTKARLPFYEEPYRFYNTDVFEYENDEPMALYGAIPMLWAVHRGEAGEKPLATAVLWINPSETFVKLERTSGAVDDGKGPAHAWFTSESGVMDVSIFVGPAPALISQQFHDLTGAAPIPPLWALGKHQCRWNYMSEKDVAMVDGNYDKYDLPYDTIWLDIEHTNGKAYFTWNDANFPTPGKMIQKISDKRRKFVNVVDPHIKKDNNYDVYTEIRDKGLFIKKIAWRQMDDPTDVQPADWVTQKKILDPNATQSEVWNEEEDGKWVPPEIDNPAYKGDWKARRIQDPSSPQENFEGWCWPGTSAYPDFTNPEMRSYWGSRFALDKYVGTNADTYIWNDMNEPSVFNGPEVTMPRDAIHPYGNAEHRDVHNMYGYYVSRATAEGLEQRVPGDRPFVLTRSYFVGTHRYASIWTGDNHAKWEHLKASIAMVGALTLGGCSLVGADVGGFFKHPDNEMMVRWYQLAVIAYPFLRNHAHLETPRREPYTLDETNMQRVRATLQLRYQMLPLWYTLFEEYHRLGAPVVRPLFWDFVQDEQTVLNEQAMEDQIMLGDTVLVHAISEPMDGKTDKVANVYLPKAEGWYDLHSGAYFKGGQVTAVPITLESIPVYYRAGSIVPLKMRVRRSSECMALDPFTLNVYVDPATNSATGRLYIDDYRTKGYQSGLFLRVAFEYKNGVLRASSTSGSLPETISVGAEIERVEVFGLPSAPKGATLKTGGSDVISLSVPVARDLPTGGVAAVVKVKPWIHLTKPDWSLELVM